MLVNREKLADLLGCSLRTVDEYRRQGMPGDAPKRAGDQWKFDTAAVVTWLRDRERQSAIGEIAQIDEGEAKRRKLAAEAAMAELALAKEERTALSVGDFAKAWAAMIGAARAKLLGLGAAMAKEVSVLEDPAECNAVIDSAVHEALQELSEFEPDLQIDPEGDSESEAGDRPSLQAVGAPSGPDGKRVGGRGKTTEPRVIRETR